MSLELIDTHCHLTDLSRDEIERQLNDAANCEVSRSICIGGSSGKESSKAAVDIANTYKNVWATVGIHPHDAGDFRSLEELEELCSNDKVVAIGETGLDYFRDWSPFDAQRELFANTIAVALNIHKPLVIHCRDAADDTLMMLKNHHAEIVGGVFHCYAQDAEFAKQLADLNFLVSFTGNITFKKANAIREVVKDVPLTQIMIETDAPYMAPEPFRGKPSEPKHVLQIANKIAEIKNCSIAQIASQTTANAIRLFGLSY